ncbi:hypothetical protein D6D01_06340 [Aureobasidium pullulans]|uniref:LDB19 N-terminal domain-containing protein n=1 Tax=Aureobasidium pullulans TaxID=5580 RepID=A0A4S9L1K4_AURPU|nr:hypothetical protein D6D01_06340 [Aureobasidium pullulans]
MPGRILGFDFPSPLLRPVPDKKRSSSSVRSDPSRHDSMEHLRRPHFGKSHSHDKKDKDGRRESSLGRQAARHVKLDMVVESPPVLFLDSPQHSSGSLFSGRMQLIVTGTTAAAIKSFTLTFRAITSTKRPVGDHCKDCSSKSTDLKEWKFLGDNAEIATGNHDFPFSYLIPGHLPTTTHGHIGSIDYKLFARAETVNGEVAEYIRPVVINRAIRPGNDKNSVRIFPPTNLTLNVTLPSVIHPIGDFPVYARMSGITTKKEDTQIRWRLRKLTWRIEEQEKFISPACPKHMGKVGGEGRGIQHEHTRDIGSDDLKSGWKTDFADGQLEGEFTASIDSGLKPQCDVDSPSGLKINHVMVLELVIAEEWAPNKKPNQATPTGAARVLRTQFNINVTERSGMGIAWEDEQPPLYEDVPASPPGYRNEIDNYDGSELNEDVDQLHLS